MGLGFVLPGRGPASMTHNEQRTQQPVTVGTQTLSELCSILYISLILVRHDIYVTI